MSPGRGSVLFWLPRTAGVAVTAFLAMFAFDAFDGRSLGQTLADVAIHLLPAAVCGALVALAWRRPWIGAVAFGLLAVAYALSVPTHREWILVISGPLALVGLLFAISPARR